MELVFWLTLGLLAFSLAFFYVWGRFTKKLIRQHNNIFELLYAMEKAEEKKDRR